jgi:hypothetical protein
MKKKTDEGRFEYDGIFFERNFIDKKFCGKGKYYFVESGKFMMVNFLNNQMYGTGVILCQNEKRYEGEFKFSKMDGN